MWGRKSPKTKNLIGGVALMVFLIRCNGHKADGVKDGAPPIEERQKRKECWKAKKKWGE